MEILTMFNKKLLFLVLYAVIYLSFRLVLGINELSSHCPLSVAFPLSVAVSIILNMGFAEVEGQHGK
jgi:hypothetical protein